MRTDISIDFQCTFISIVFIVNTSYHLACAKLYNIDYVHRLTLNKVKVRIDITDDGIGCNESVCDTLSP